MRQEQREQALNLLFGSMVGQLNDLRESGVEVPSEVFLYLGMLQGNMSGIMNHIATNHDLEIDRLKRKLKGQEELEEEAEEEPEEPETNNRNVVRLRDDK